MYTASCPIPTHTTVVPNTDIIYCKIRLIMNLGRFWALFNNTVGNLNKTANFIHVMVWYRHHILYKSDLRRQLLLWNEVHRQNRKYHRQAASDRTKHVWWQLTMPCSINSVHPRAAVIHYWCMPPKVSYTPTIHICRHTHIHIHVPCHIPDNN